ncbi:hypothetical protein GA0061105_13918 [Rhizobium aethiopicum]|uniref:Uncharacterized protein n=1 Tax=Rhizobium aethiopicum TaxID=1138170 RepID=A0A1C3YD76_9HYPH|nr:hypothetical protein GA0061105_13918 [Rhizobium aethiopicum]
MNGANEGSRHVQGSHSSSDRQLGITYYYNSKPIGLGPILVSMFNVLMMLVRHVNEFVLALVCQVPPFASGAIFEDRKSRCTCFNLGDICRALILQALERRIEVEDQASRGIINKDVSERG